MPHRKKTWFSWWICKVYKNFFSYVMMKEKKSEHEWKYSINNKIIEYHPTKGKRTISTSTKSYYYHTYHAPMHHTNWHWY